MRFQRVPVKMYKKFFIILLCVFLGLFALEFIASMLGNPISETTINDVEIIPETPEEPEKEESKKTTTKKTTRKTTKK